MADETKALATVPKQEMTLLRPLVSPATLVEVHKEMTELIKTAMEEGTDYGVIPGTKEKVLLKPGAERLTTAFGCYPKYTILECEVDHNKEVAWKKRKKVWGQQRGQFKWVEESGKSLGLYRYVIRCQLINRSNEIVIGDGLGSASTIEGKYIDRPRDSENVVLKMAQKRAYVAACLNTFGLSGRFTQDIEEDIVEHVIVDRQAQKTSKPTQQTTRKKAENKPEMGPEPPPIEYNDSPSDESNAVPTADDIAAMIKAFEKFKLYARDLENYLDKKIENLINRDLDKLRELYKEINNTPPQYRDETIRQIFDLEQGSLG